MATPPPARDRYLRVKQLLLEALEVEPAQRAAFLDGAIPPSDAALRAEVEELLRFEAEGDDALDAPAPIPERIGRYRILRLLGEGGMGAVYEAEQDVPRRRVALKVIRSPLVSPETRRRFEREVELLGRLEHPGIARVYDAGSTEDADRIPYLAMELVEGPGLGTWVTRHRPTVERRLRLLIDLCDAVEHAHRHGVIHRDLKPSNVLVDPEGQPKVLDFGIARALEGGTETLLTAAHQLLGTLPYMSPEQCSGDPAQVETRSDVYALGVLAYEVLTGHLPRELGDAPLTEAIRRIREDDPVPLGARDRGLRGDLQTVVHRALAAEPSRRYPSAGAFADDLRRILASEPVQARPATTGYVVRRFVRRHRVLVASTCAVILALSIGIGVALRQAGLERDARLAADEARKTAETALEGQDLLNEFLVELLGSASPYTLGPEATARELVDHARPEVARRFADRADLRARAHLILGQTYSSFGAHDIAVEELDAAVADLRSLGDSAAPGQLAYTLGELAHAGLLAHRFDAAAVAAEEALQRSASLQGADRQLHFHVLLTSAAIEVNRNRLEAAKVCLDRARAIADAHTAQKLPDRLLGLMEQQLGTVAMAEGDMPRAIEHLEHAVALRSDATAGQRHELAQSVGALAIACMRAGRLDAADHHLEAQLRLHRELFGDADPSLAILTSNRGSLLRSRGELDGAEACYREAVAISRVHRGDAPAGLAINLHNLGSLLRARDRIDEALPLLEESLQLGIEVHGEASPAVAGTLSELAKCRHAQGQLVEALALRRRQHDALLAVHGPDHPAVDSVGTALRKLEAQLDASDGRDNDRRGGDR